MSLMQLSAVKIDEVPVDINGLRRFCRRGRLVIRPQLSALDGKRDAAVPEIVPQVVRFPELLCGSVKKKKVPSRGPEPLAGAVYR